MTYSHQPTATIDIVGGGVAGLALAALIDPQHWTVRLHEAAPDQTRVPTCFGIWPFARPILRQLGFDDLVTTEGVLVRGGRLISERGRTLINSTKVTIPLVTRPQLLDWLDSSVPGTVQRLHHRVEDPSELSGDVIVGADGAHSALRQTVFGRAARSTGYQALRGVVPGRTPTGAEFWGRGLHFGYTPHPQGMTNWFATTPEVFTSPAEALERARGDFAGFPAMVGELLQRASDEQTLVNRIVEAPPLPSFVGGRHVLIGDAAHAMCPNLGRGACESLLDAATLATELNHSASTPDTALAAYNHQRRRHTQRIRRASRLMQRLSVRQIRPARVRS